MVSGNPPLPDFTSLSEAEQRVVAEALLRIKESGWKPFWCPNPRCAGAPHPVLDKSGAATFVSDSTPHTQDSPVGHLYEHIETGETRVIDPKTADADWVLMGRVALDPKWAHNHAREDQRLPRWQDPWTLFIMSGRGSGKTRTGVEFVTLNARRGLDGAIVGRRGTELENTHVKALIENAHPEFVPTYLASKDIIVWPSPDGGKTPGATTFLFSAERPENIRSVNLSYVWFDEAAFMDEIETAWRNAKMATRVKNATNPIHRLITSTPTSTPWVMKMEEDPTVEVRRVSTYANRANLSSDFLADLEREYEGTRIGRQELYGEVLRDVEGALWNDDMFKHLPCKDPSAFEDLLDSMDDRVLAVDPAGSKGKRSDATGLIVVGVQHSDDAGVHLSASQFYVLGDGTLKGSPTEWAAQTYKIARQMRVSRIVVERNFGADMVKQTLVDYAKSHREECLDENGEEYLIKEVHAEKSKETRAEPTVGKYEQGRVTHVISPGTFGDMSALEKEQTMWVPKSRGGKSPSPNRVDALVWAVRACESKVRFSTAVASQSSVRDMLVPNHVQPTISPTAAPPVWVPAPPTVQVAPPVRESVREFKGDKGDPAKRYPVKLPPIRRR